MFGLYTKRDVQMLVRRLRDEYDAALKEQKAASEELKAENRALSARVSELEGERGSVSEALVHAVKEGERIKEEGSRAAENGQKEFALLAEKCRLFLAKLMQKYPDEEDTQAFAAFVESLSGALGEEEEESELDMDEVLAPKQPLDLGKLCKDLGLMEDGE